jgi:Fe(II)/alpha-ketoglutarate-dependent arginine beta-hydroxylase
MRQLILDEEEVRSVKLLAGSVAEQYIDPGNETFLKDAVVFAHQLPERVRRFINDFRLLEPVPGVCLISGYPLDQSKLGRTPSHWKDLPKRSPCLEEEIVLMLFGSLLGDIFGWVTQQDGHILHEVCPIKGHEDEQLGTGSEQLLEWHSEDAFHPYRGDYLGLMCLRNPDRVATTIASVEEVAISPEYRQILFREVFHILPDESHLKKNSAREMDTASGEDTVDASVIAFRAIDQMASRPKDLAVLFGDSQVPYIRIDPYFMPRPSSPEAQAALDALIRSVDASLSEIVLQPGDFCFLDNYRVVHGRRSFRARFDGADRWLKRINITRDLRKSRSGRVKPESRLIG